MARNDRRLRSTGSPQDSRQYELPWPLTTQAPTTAGDRHGRDEAKLPSELDVATTHAGQTDASANPLPQGSEPPAVVSPVRNERRRPLHLRDRVERLLRDHGIPYVNVDEAKRALFASAKLRAFHFVAYAKDGPNWLIFAARADRRVRETMAEWERVFGDGFIAVLTTPATGKAAGIRFRSLDGKRLALTESDGHHTQGMDHAKGTQPRCGGSKHGAPVDVHSGRARPN